MLPALMVIPTTRTKGLLVGLRGGLGHASQTATRQANCIHRGRDRSRVTSGRDGGRRAPHSVIASVTSGPGRAPTRVLLVRTLSRGGADPRGRHSAISPCEVALLGLKGGSMKRRPGMTLPALNFQ